MAPTPCSDSITASPRHHLTASRTDLSDWRDAGDSQIQLKARATSGVELYWFCGEAFLGSLRARGIPWRGNPRRQPHAAGARRPRPHGGSRRASGQGVRGAWPGLAVIHFCQDTRFVLSIPVWLVSMCSNHARRLPKPDSFDPSGESGIFTQFPPPPKGSVAMKSRPSLRYPEHLKAELKSRRIQLDTRSNGPAIAAFLYAGGERPTRVGSRNSWSIHHLHSGKFPYLFRTPSNTTWNPFVLPAF